MFDRHLSEHPLVGYHEGCGDGRAVKISDFLTQGQFHRLGLYQEFYRMMDVEHQMAIALPAAPCYMIGIVLSRKRPDFSERDRLLLNRIRPHLIQAYRNAAASTRLRHGVGRLEEAMEAMDCGIMLLSSQGRVLWMTERARRCAGEYFKPSPNWGPQLPESLARWVKRQQALLGKGDEMPPLLGPLAVEREGKR